MLSKKELTLYNEKYKKVKLLGKGAFGTVYMVEEIQENKEDILEIDNKIYSMKKFYLDNVRKKFFNCSLKSKIQKNPWY